MNFAPARVAALLVLAAGAGCAAPASPPSTPVDADPPLAGGRALRCFRIAEVDNWRVIDERQLVVYTRGRRQAWHLKLFMRCDGLHFTETMGFTAGGANLICGDPGDDIVFRGRRCAISEVRAISPAEERALLDGGVHDDIGKLPAQTSQEGEGDEEGQ
jgi:Family of unknown function (DUF6491)